MCTDLRSIDSKKASSFEKRTPPLSPLVEVDDGDEDDDDMKKKKKTTKIIKLDIKFSNPTLIFFFTILCQITISFKYYLLKTNYSR
jgi:hypothetical protein